MIISDQNKLLLVSVTHSFEHPDNLSSYVRVDRGETKLLCPRGPHSEVLEQMELLKSTLTRITRGKKNLRRERSKDRNA